MFEEYGAIWGPDDRVKDPAFYYEEVNRQGQAALCLSGGGIRSGAFALGLLQVFGRAGLLGRFHYLSTVSGGGYMGSWLQRWIHVESRPQGEAEPGSWNSSPAGLAGVIAKLAKAEEPDEIKRLRENSNFITPKVGIGSNDTWTAVAISVRNIVVNWLLFVPLLMLAALFPNLLLESVDSIRGAVHWDVRVLYGLLGLAALCIARATFATARLLPSYRPASKQREDEDAKLVRTGAGDAVMQRRIVYPLIAWSILATLALSVELLDPAPVKLIMLPRLLIGNGVDVAVFSLGGMVAGLILAAATLRGDQLRTFAKDYFIWPAAFLVTSLWVALGAILLSRSLQADSDWGPVLLATAGPLWLLLATMIGAIVFAAFRQSEGPSVRPDDDREWLARLSAVKIVPMLGWALLAASVLLLNRLGSVDANHSQLSWPGLVALLSGASAVFGGRSERTGATAVSGGRTLFKYLPLRALIGLATLLFIIALLMIFGRLEAMLSALVMKGVGPYLPAAGWAGWYDLDVVAHLGIALILIGLIAFLGRHIPVNRFTLNGLYRNRLARGFLGAARPGPERKPDPFTGFDSADNVRLHLLAPKKGERAILYPVINASLNVTATENLAWQERKAEPFVFTPHYCGSGMLSRAPKSPSRRTGAYVETAIYAGREPDFGMSKEETAAGGETPLGVTLATAMALSGAAATPNMGYYSSPATAFLMTLFNVRLGAWLPNPAMREELKEGISRSSPKNSVRALLSELTGSTHDRGKDIYLSDGGHFENLGLYEMIRRRCRFIVVSDAAADPACSLKDLGNAVRKVKIDFDVDIKFGALHLSGRDKPLKPELQLAWAIGEIAYPDFGADGQQLGGVILYIKPSFFGEDDGLPIDVVAYARGNRTFPHESTADQFFSESQFESYRRLADHFAGQLVDKMKKTRKATHAVGGPEISDLVAAAQALAEVELAAEPKPAARRRRPAAGKP